MKSRRVGRIVCVTGCVVLLIDGAAAIWLGQLTDRLLLIVVGLVLLAGALFLGLMYGRWMDALEDVDAAMRDRRLAADALRRGLEEGRARGSHFD